MNAKEQIQAIKGMKTVKEVEAVLKAEKDGKNRSTVINACEERIGEITTGGGEAPAETPKKADESKDNKSEKKEEEVKEPTKEEKRIAEFKRKTQHFIPCKNIEKFAHEFFGKEVKKVATKECLVTITLKSGAKVTQRGN